MFWFYFIVTVKIFLQKFKFFIFHSFFYLFIYSVNLLCFFGFVHLKNFKNFKKTIILQFILKNHKVLFTYQNNI